jgi:glucose-1-phosphate thymidylyltransferase
VNLKGIIMVADAGSEARSSRAGFRLDAGEHVANRPIAHHVLDALESAGVEEIVVASSAGLAGDVRECLESERRRDTRLRFVEQPAPLTLADALSLAAPIIDGAACVFHLANGLLGEQLGPLVDRLRVDSADVVLIVHEEPAPDEHLAAASQDILHIAELDPARAALGMTGVCLFGPDALRNVGDAAWRAGGVVDLTMIAERIAHEGGSFHVRRANAWRRYTGDPLDLLELNQIALDRLESNASGPNQHGNRIEGRVQIHQSASVRSSVIVGPTVIGPGVSIANAYIGPYTSVGAGARIEGAEIERSIISAGASVMHIGLRLVASVVGRDARVFRDFSLPRALRLRVGDGTEVALC